MPETVEKISEKPEVREELARTAGEKPREKVKARARDKFWFVTHALLLLGCTIIYFLPGSKRYVIPPREAGRIKTRLIKKRLAALNAAPEKVMFPAGANR
jgi:hypothetical protein